MHLLLARTLLYSSYVLLVDMHVLLVAMHLLPVAVGLFVWGVKYEPKSLPKLLGLAYVL